jgi:hypothetical protein
MCVYSRNCRTRSCSDGPSKSGRRNELLNSGTSSGCGAGSAKSNGSMGWRSCVLRWTNRSRAGFRMVIVWLMSPSMCIVVTLYSLISRTPPIVTGPGSMRRSCSMRQETPGRSHTKPSIVLLIDSMASRTLSVSRICAPTRSLRMNVLNSMLRRRLKAFLTVSKTVPKTLPPTHEFRISNQSPELMVQMQPSGASHRGLGRLATLLYLCGHRHTARLHGRFDSGVKHPRGSSSGIRMSKISAVISSGIEKSKSPLSSTNRSATVSMIRITKSPKMPASATRNEPTKSRMSQITCTISEITRSFGISARHSSTSARVSGSSGGARGSERDASRSAKVNRSSPKTCAMRARIACANATVRLYHSRMGERHSNMLLYGSTTSWLYASSNASA